MYTLYYSPGACSMAVHALLNEIEVPYELRKVDIHGPRSPEFLKVNPRGQVPVLVDNGEAIREGAAIILHLLEKHKSPLLPKEGIARARALEWLMFANASLHPAYGRMFFLMKNAKDQAGQEQLMQATADQINALWKEVDAQLGKTRYVAGDECTAADVLLAVIANWNGYFQQTVTLGGNVKRMLKEVSGRPSWRKTLQEEQVEYKAAA